MIITYFVEEKSKKYQTKKLRLILKHLLKGAKARSKPRTPSLQKKEI